MTTYDRDQDPMQRPEEYAYAPEPPKKRSGWGCLIYGCLFMALGAILLLIGLTFGAYFLVKGQIDKYTAAEPIDLPVVELPAEELEELHGRIDTFRESVEEGTEEEAPAPMTFVLTEEELNALVAEEPKLRGRVHVEIEEGQVRGEVSLPTDMLPIGKGRFFNASVTLNAALVNGELYVTLIDAQVNGEPLPEQFMIAVKGENLAADMNKDPEFTEALSQFDSIEIGDGQITLTATPHTRTAGEETDEQTESPEEAEASTEEGPEVGVEGDAAP